MPPLAFLVPAFLVGLAAIVIPVLVHLTRRQRAKILRFPSLMFLEKVPYKAESRRQIHHWVLLLMRALAVALLVAAFARPFFVRESDAGAASGPREVVILLDQSYSMGVGDHWERGVAAAQGVIDELGPLDRASLVLFARSASVLARSTGDRVRLRGALDTIRVSSEATSYGPGLKLAETILDESELPSGELVLISDFQRPGWTGEEGVSLPVGSVVTPIPLAGQPPENLAIAGVTLTRQVFSGNERVSPTARVTRVGGAGVRTVEATLEVDGRELQRQEITLSEAGAAQVAFQPFTISETHARGTIRIEPDLLAQDNEHHFVVSPGEATSVLLVGTSGNAANAARSTLYLSSALEISEESDFDVTSRTNGPTAEDLVGRHVVILHDRPYPGGSAGRALATFVEAGGGLVVALGEQSSWPAEQDSLLPGVIGSVSDREEGRGAQLGNLDYGHPVFEVFSGPRGGDFTAARFLRARPLNVTAREDVTVLARFDDGSVALAEKRYGEGRVLLWTSTLDAFWNDLALKPVYLPFVHQLVRYASGRTAAVPSFVAGQVIDVSDARAMATAGLGEAATALASAEEWVAFSPGGESIEIPEGSGPHYLALSEQGFYEIRTPGNTEVRPLAVAVNVDLAEADLTPLDPREVTTSIMGTGDRSPGREESARVEALRKEDQERRQSLWRLLLLAAFIVLMLETVVSNRIRATTGRRGAHARA